MQQPRSRRALVGLVAVTLGLAVLAGGVAPEAAFAKTRPTRYYVSLGDSTAMGFRPGMVVGSSFTPTVAKKAKMIDANFACAGASAATISIQIGCSLGAIGGQQYPTTTQADAAVAFIQAHHGEVGLITITLGGNDLVPCISSEDPSGCVLASGVAMNLSALAGQLRSVAGSSVPMIGVTYFAGPLWSEWVTGGTSGVARLTNVIRTISNPALAGAYATAGARFADITSASGAYTPLTVLKNVNPYGKIPRAVANVCKYTYACQSDQHTTPKGNKLVAKEIIRVWKAFPKV
jgi:hypothetical protein